MCPAVSVGSSSLCESDRLRTICDGSSSATNFAFRLLKIDRNELLLFVFRLGVFGEPSFDEYSSDIENEGALDGYCDRSRSDAFSAVAENQVPDRLRI